MIIKQHVNTAVQTLIKVFVTIKCITAPRLIHRETVAGDDSIAF